MDTPTTRPPAVAGRFYPGSAESLKREVEKLQPTPSPARQKALAVVSPHAGYIYSGMVAAATIARIEVPETVIILGPNHHGQGVPVALSTIAWEMPLGTVPVDQEFASRLLLESEIIEVDERAHKYEHSLEVQVPFLQERQPNLAIVPLVLSHISFPLCQEIGEAIARAISNSGKEVLILASSDMTHYEAREAASKKDQYALKKLTDMDPSILYHSILDHRISMCGIIPVTVALIAALALGATKTEVVRYQDSGEVTGDTSQVVGYAGVIIS